MAKYRKKPVIVEAELYVEGMEDGFYDVIGSFLEGIKGVPKPYINTLEGREFITDGDYIITGIKGERYLCKPDIFKETYEKI